MSKISRNGLAVVAVMIGSALASAGCKDDTASKGRAGGNPATALGAAAKAPDLSSPKSAAVAFTKAFAGNDMSAARAASTGTEEQYKTLESVSSYIAAMNRYRSAAAATFGDAGKIGEGMPDMVAQTEASDVRVEGDSATVVNREIPNEKNPMKLVKKDGHWKVDLASMEVDAATKKLADDAPKLKQALDETAAEIKRGKYNTAQEAQQALTMRMNPAAPG